MGPAEKEQQRRRKQAAAGDPGFAFQREKRDLIADAIRRSAAEKAFLEQPEPKPAPAARAPVHQYGEAATMKGGAGRQMFAHEQAKKKMAKQQKMRVMGHGIRAEMLRRKALEQESRDARRAVQMEAMQKRGVTGLQTSAELAKQQQARVAAFKEAGAREREKTAIAARTRAQQREAGTLKKAAEAREPQYAPTKPLVLEHETTPTKTADVQYDARAIAKLREHKMMRKEKLGPKGAPTRFVRQPQVHRQPHAEMPTAVAMHEAALRKGREPPGPPAGKPPRDLPGWSTGLSKVTTIPKGPDLAALRARGIKHPDMKSTPKEKRERKEAAAADAQALPGSRQSRI